MGEAHRFHPDVVALEVEGLVGVEADVHAVIVRQPSEVGPVARGSVSGAISAVRQDAPDG